ncbi:MAG: hypothetical protein QXM16_04155 [Nitrososphaerota archaeon]
MYVDSLPVEVYHIVLKLLKRGVRVSALRRRDILSKLRAENSVKKTDENDAKILSKIDNTYYRELREDEIESGIMLQKYHNVQKVLKLAKQLDSDGKVINQLRRTKRRLMKMIIDKAEEIVPNYIVVVERLQLSRKSPYSRVALAELLLSVDFDRGFKKR